MQQRLLVSPESGLPRRTSIRKLAYLPVASCLLILAGLPAAAAIDGVIPGTKAYESYRSKGCPGASACYLKFAPVPKGAVLKITNVNCGVNIEQDEEWTLVHLFQGPVASAQPKVAFRVDALPGGGLKSLWMNEVTATFIEGGARPWILITPGRVTPTLAGDCKISGEIIKTSP